MNGQTHYCHTCHTWQALVNGASCRTCIEFWYDNRRWPTQADAQVTEIQRLIRQLAAI